jgi:farnesyl-diphosphate farnesyltransferase
VERAANALLTDLLRSVSRSFYLTLRVLPAAVRPQIGLAYLLARATDTIADTNLVSVERRLDALAALRARILGERGDAVNFGEIAAAQPGQAGGGSNAEHTLLQRVEQAVAVLNAFTPRDRQLIRDVLVTITSGQDLDLRRFGGATAESIAVLATDAELDDYTWRVAGCVGEFWTRICRAHLFPDARLDDAALLRDGVRFGRGLQLVNILRDVPGDLRQGRCYLPVERLARAGLTAPDLLEPRNIERLRPVYNDLLDLAEGHLAAGWNYTNALPRSAVRVRLSCAWPVLIGVKTLSKLRSGNVLDPACRIKVSRAEVRHIMAGTLVQYPLAGRWQKLFSVARG